MKVPNEVVRGQTASVVYRTSWKPREGFCKMGEHRKPLSAFLLRPSDGLRSKVTEVITSRGILYG